MAFDALELSRFLGRPVRLYMFTLTTAPGVTEVWRFAQCDRDVVISGNTWLAAQIDRDEIRQTSEKAKDKLKIRMDYLRDPFALPTDIPTTQALGDLWHPYIPSAIVQVMCLTTHYGDASAPVLEWSGEVVQPQYTDTQLELTCVPGSALSEARGQGAKWQRACWKSPYSTGPRGCNLDPADFEVPATLSAVDGLTLTSSAFAGAPLSLLQGSLRWELASGRVEKRTIVAHDGADVTLLYGGPELAAGLDVVALPGCPGTWAACVERDNTINYGGAIYKPVDNPDGVSMSWGL